MNKLTRIVTIACLSFLGIAGAAFGLGYASWVYSDGGAAAQAAKVAASIGKWTYLNGFFYLMNSDGTVDWNTKITPAVYDPNPSNTKHLYYVENPADTNVCAYYPYGYLPSGSTTYSYFTGTEQHASKTNQFANSGKVEQIYLPSSYSSIGEYSYYYARNLNEVHFYDATSEGAAAAKKLSIGQYAFYGASELTSFAFPSIPTTIDTAAFYGTNFSSLDLSNVTSIGHGAIGSNTQLSAVTLSNKLATLGSYAFINDSSLPSITIPSKITAIPEELCSSCTSLNSVTFNGKIKTIDTAAFIDCKNLITISLPSSLKSIADRAYALTTTHRPLFVNFDGTKAQWNAVTKASTWAQNRTVYLRCLADEKTVTTESTVKKFLEDHPDPKTEFAGSTVTVTCADGVIHYMDNSNQYTVEMGDSAAQVPSWETYYDKDNLLGIKLNANNSTISTGAFMDRANLAYVDFSATKDLKIGAHAFRNCTSLTSFVPGVNVLSIDDEAFSGCTSLKEVEFSSDSDLTLSTHTFPGCTSLTSVNISSKGNMSIDAGSFNYDTALTSLTLTSGGTMSIKGYVYKGCSALAEVNINAAGATTFGGECFADCTSLPSIDLSHAPKLSMGSGCFTGDNILATIDLPGDFTTISAWSLSVSDSAVNQVLTLNYPLTKADYLAKLGSVSPNSLTNRKTLQVSCSDGVLTYTR